MPNAKGDSRERELVRLFENRGWNAFRAAGSGGGTSNPRPDVIAGNGKKCYAFEVKSSAADSLYLDGNECEQLCYLARGICARPRIAVRFDYEDWYFFHPGELHVTSGGNYRVKRDMAVEYGVSMEDGGPGEAIGIFV